MHFISFVKFNSISCRETYLYCIFQSMSTGLIYFDRTLAQLEDDVAPCEAQMENWKTNLAVMASKERQYLQQYNNYKVLTFCCY